MIAGSEGAEIRLWRPDLRTLPLKVEHGSITIPKTGMDNYHAIVAEKDWGNLRETVIRYEYLRGKPSERSPSELTAAEKATFEIVPEPLPREHQHFFGGTSWTFLIRFKGRPLGARGAILETSNGSRLEAVSSPGGRVTFTLPDDFAGIVPGERDPRAAEFQVTAEHRADGIVYQTMLSAEYRVSPAHWRSTPMGLGVMALGFLVGIGLKRGRFRRRVER